MNLATFLKTVEGSTPDQWHKMDMQHVFGWEWGQKDGGNYIEPKTFDVLAVYQEDIDISLLMTATVNDDFQEPWVRVFPNPKAKSASVVLRYRGVIVYEWVGVIVDGFNHLLPMPEIADDEGYTVEQADMPLARLFYAVYGATGVHQTVESVLQRAGIKIV